MLLGSFVERRARLIYDARAPLTVTTNHPLLIRGRFFQTGVRLDLILRVQGREVLERRSVAYVIMIQ